MERCCHFKSKNYPTLIIADLILEDGNFLGLLGQDWLSQFIAKVPLIVVSSIDEMDALRTCFDFGAVDYITKPFSKNEILVKLEKILKEKKVIGKKLRPKVTIDGIVIENLTSKQIQLIQVFLDCENRVVNRDLLKSNAWSGMNVASKAIDVHIYNLRRKIAPYGLIIKSLGAGQWKLLNR